MTLGWNDFLQWTGRAWWGLATDSEVNGLLCNATDGIVLYLPRSRQRTTCIMFSLRSVGMTINAIWDGEALTADGCGNRYTSLCHLATALLEMVFDYKCKDIESLDSCQRLVLGPIARQHISHGCHGGRLAYSG
ncbi:hypothetical protein AAFF_G00160890 [Aldrovandia affinis]|uniref:Uncharacterized protein n=1 Tax=Aldrovandia affinis TaxID=143900 RepID=A0AAD7R0I3_9TELE|nr:hypothetical protein AAFF_G00160890 [Aldrovandia affinis]